jgi:large subunit ribosomal protein L15
MPLIRRVPKFGFTSPFRVEYQVVNLSTLETLAKEGRIAGGKISPEELYALGAVSRKSAPVKILGEGALTATLNVSAHAFSKSAVQKIEAAGGKALTVPTTKK